MLGVLKGLGRFKKGYVGIYRENGKEHGSYYSGLRV